MNREGGPDWAVIFVAVVAVALAFVAGLHVLGIRP